MLNYILPSYLIWFALFSSPVHAISNTQEMQDVQRLQQSWAIGKYQTEKSNQKAYFSKLYEDSKKALNTNQKSAKLWIWHGIIASTFAEVKGGLKALGLAKESKASLEKAISLDPNALDGAAYTSLGVLYEQVPGWPIGFGSDKKANYFYRTALKMNPNGIDINYFYGAYLLSQGKKKLGMTHLQKALDAPARVGRELADKGRRSEIHSLLSKVNETL